MRLYGRDYRTAETAAETLGVDRDEAVKMLQEFVEAGYLDERESQYTSGDDRERTETEWFTTIRGNALAMAGFGKPITRTKAEQLVAGIIERVKHYNQDPIRLLSITKVTVFGSYLDPAVDRLGDVDIAIAHDRRQETVDPSAFYEQRREYARPSGAAASVRSDFMSTLTWPEIEVVRIVKNRSTAISVTDEDVSKITDRFEVIYAIENDEGAIALAAKDATGT